MIIIGPPGQARGSLSQPGWCVFIQSYLRLRLGVPPEPEARPGDSESESLAGWHLPVSLSVCVFSVCCLCVCHGVFILFITAVP